MTDVCVEECAINRDCRHFRAKDINLDDMPRFPDAKDMTKEERFTAVTVYLAKVVDHLKGEDHGTVYLRRPHTNRFPGSQIPPDLKVEGLLSTVEASNAEDQDRPEHKNSAIGSGKVGE
jgi:hypothetical protein